MVYLFNCILCEETKTYQKELKYEYLIQKSVLYACETW
jgi:hypothetical protein